MELKKKIGRKEEETILPFSHPATDPLQTRTISSLCCPLPLLRLRPAPRLAGLLLWGCDPHCRAGEAGRGSW